MEVVFELSLCINLFLNSFILKLTGLVLKEKANLWFISALFGSIVSLLSPLFILSITTKIVLQVATSIIMVLISFKYKNLKKFVLIISIFVLVTFVFGGGCLALRETIGDFPLFVVAIVSSVLYFIIKTILRVQRKLNTIKNFTYKIVFKDNGKIIDEEGFLDSGNMLYDSITKKPIILINFDVFHKLYDNVSYLSVISKTFDEGSIKNGHYIKINSIGCGTRMFVFSVDEIKVGEDHSFNNVMLGLSFSGFEKSFGKKVLLHSELI